MDRWAGLESQSDTGEFPGERLASLIGRTRLTGIKVYRETDKRSTNPPTPISGSNPTSISPSQNSPSSNPFIRPGGPNALPGPAQYAESSQMAATGGPSQNVNDPPPVLGGGALHRPRSSSDGGGAVERQRERQLVGSLTNSYKFKDGGLVKKVRAYLSLSC